MRHIITSAAVAATLLGTLATANAQDRYRGYRDRDGMWDAPVSMQQDRYHAYRRPVGPPWRGPNQCFVDLGYGRYESCDK